MKKHFNSKPIFKVLFYLFLVLFLSGIFFSIGVKAKNKEYLKILEHNFSSFSPNGDGSKDEGIFSSKVQITKEKGPRRIRWELKVSSQDGREILYREKDMEEIPEGEGIFVIEIKDTWDGRDKGGSILPDGLYSYTFTVKYKGDKESVSGNVKIDTLAPNIKITSPPDGMVFYTSPIEVFGNVDDPNALIRLNGKEIPNQNGSFSVSLELEEGENRISASAEDESGNIGRDSITVKYIPDRNPPVVNIIEPQDGSEISTTKPRIEISYSDDLSGLEISSLKILINEGDWTSKFTISNEGAFWQVDQDGIINEGENIIQASIKDKANPT